MDNVNLTLISNVMSFYLRWLLSEKRLFCQRLIHLGTFPLAKLWNHPNKDPKQEFATFEFIVGDFHPPR